MRKAGEWTTLNSENVVDLLKARWLTFVPRAASVSKLMAPGQLSRNRVRGVGAGLTDLVEAGASRLWMSGILVRRSGSTAQLDDTYRTRDCYDDGSGDGGNEH